MTYIENRSLKIKLKGKNQFNIFIQKDFYEKYLYDLIKQSSFFNKLEQIEEQNNKEDDYREFNNEGQVINTYEVTLLANEGIMRGLSLEGNFFPISKMKKFIDETKKEFKNALERKLTKNNAKNNRNIIIFNLLPIENKFQPNKEIASDILLSKKSEFKREGFKVNETKDNDIWYKSLKEVNSNNPALLKNKEKIYIVSFNVDRERCNFYIKKLCFKNNIEENYVFEEQIEFINNYKDQIYPFEVL